MQVRRIVLLLVTLLSLSTFSQTTNVWYETRGDSTVIVVTNQRGKEIAQKLVEGAAMKDSVAILNEMNRFNDSIQSNMQERIDLLKETNEQCSAVNDLKDSQIENHIKIEGILEDEIKAQKKKRWLFAGGGLLGGLLIGILVK